MGNVNALSAQNQLNEIARMSYGSGFFEKESGGKGNIGLVTGADGKPRVIKFNTHYRERGGVATADQIKSSNALRAQLLSIAKTLNPGVVAELRAKLGLGAGEDASAGQTLLTRKIAAAAVKLINANGMKTAMKGVNAESLKSVGGTKFEEAGVYAKYGISAKTLKACGEMSTTEFESSVNAMAAKFHLSVAQKQAVGRATASYLTALAEEGKTGQLDEEGNPKKGLPSKDELKRQISEGKFGGTYFGLAHVRAFSALVPPFKADDELFMFQSLALSSSLSDDECADAAYFIAKMGTGKRGEDGFDNWLSTLALKTLVDHRTELMALHRRNGTLTVNDMWKVVVGRDVPEGGGTAGDFNVAIGRKLFDEIVRSRPAEAMGSWSGDYVKFDYSLLHMMMPVVDYGVSVDVAVKLYFGEDAGDVQCSHTASAYDVTSAEYQGANEQKLASVISGDINRIAGDSSIMVVNGDDTYHLPIPKGAGDDFANGETPELMKAMNRLIGGGNQIGNPVPNQLKTMCYLCGQSGNSFLTLAGVKAAGEGDADHYPVDKSFTLQEDGSVMYTASAEVKGVKHTIQYQIEKDGTSHLVDYSRATLEEVQLRTAYGIEPKTLHACGMSAADFESSVNAVAEKFNLSPAQKQAVGRATASYLTALAEEGKTGKPGQEGLPSKDELKRQISEGKFGGTYFGLAHVRAFSTMNPPFKADDNLFNPQPIAMSSSLSDDECAAAAYFIAKMGTGKRGKDGGPNWLSALALKTLVDHRTELMALHQRNGTLTINDMWKVVVGRDVPEDEGTAEDFNAAIERKLFDEIVRSRPAEAMEKWRGDYLNFVDSLTHMMVPVIEYGVSVDVAVKLYLGVDVDDIQCSHTASAYDVTTEEYQEAGEARFFERLTDIGDINGKSSISVGTGEGAYTLDIPWMAGKDFANRETPELMKAMNRLVGGGEEIGNPVPNQLKTMCYMCSQAGNGFLSLSGMKVSQFDHYPVDKSFTLQEDGSVLYTASAEVKGVKHTIQYQIEKDGTSHLVDYSRAESPETVALMQPFREVATPRLDKLADFVRTNGTEAEKANLANYKDGIVTAKNVRILKDKVGKALANRPASVAQNVMANLMAFFAEINFRQAAKGVPLDSFETLLSRYAGNDEQIRLLDFSLSANQLKTMPEKMKNWLVNGFTNRMGKKHFHDKTNVHVLSLREFNYVNVSINGKQPPELKSMGLVEDADVKEKEIKDGDKTITTADLVSLGGTGDPGADTLGRLAFHELLVTTFPDPKVRAFVSYLMSMSEGVRGCYTNMFDMPGPDNVTGTEIPQCMQLMPQLQMHGVNAQPAPMDMDVEAKGVYAITIEPDEIGQNGEVVKKGKIKVVVSSAEGMAIKGRDVLGLKFSAQPNEKMEFVLAHQAYETTITIDPNEIGENGIPSFTVDEPVLK